MSGTTAVKFAGACDLDHGRGLIPARGAFGGLAPARPDFSASAILGRVRRQDFRGRLRVEPRRDAASIARADPAAPFNHVRVQSAGAGLRGAIPTPIIDIAPEARGRIVPLLTRTMVPPLRARLFRRSPAPCGRPRARRGSFKQDIENKGKNSRWAARFCACADHDSPNSALIRRP